MKTITYGNKEIEIPEVVKLFSKAERIGECLILPTQERKRKYPYVCIRHNEKTVKVNAHRLAFVIAKGQVPAGLHVCHSCDNFRCINPEHLFAETPSKNRFDAYARGRQLGRAKLTPEDRKTIAFFGSAKWRGVYAAISRIYGVNEATVSRIVARHS